GLPGGAAGGGDPALRPAVAVPRPRASEPRERLDLGLAAALDSAGDRHVTSALPQEDQLVDLGGGGDRQQEPDEALAQGRLGIAQVGAREGGLDLVEDPLLLPAEQRPEELVLARVAGLADPLADPPA